MSGTKNLEREQLRRFVQYWDDLLQIMPEARREAVEAAGKEIQLSLESQIQQADLDSEGVKGRVKSWQALRLGSGGGWAAVSPKSEKVESWEQRITYAGRFKQHTWKGKPVTSRQVTSWLDRGHGTGTTGQTAWVLTKQNKRHQRKERWGSGYVAGRKFYAKTKDDAQKLALKAANQVLFRIANELGFKV